MNILMFFKLFDELTLYFSQAEMPLIADTIGALEDLLTALKRVRDDPDSSDVVRVAACAAVLVAEKYYSLTDDCEVYAIAISKILLPLSDLVELIPTHDA